MKKFLYIFTGCILGTFFTIAVLILVSRTLYVNTHGVGKDSLQTYVSTKGFSFQYPKGYVVLESTDKEDNSQVLHIVEVDAKGETVGVPRLIIKTYPPYNLEFSLWEGIGWSYFETVTRSFSFNQQAPEVDPGPPQQ